MKTTKSTARGPRRPAANRWFVRLRQWHSWLGLGASVLILAISGTGLLLNHKDLIEDKMKGWKQVAWPPAELASRDGGPVGSSLGALTAEGKFNGTLRSSTGADELVGSLDHALRAACEILGDTRLEKIELKKEGGRLMYKVVSLKKREVRVEAATGRAYIKGKRPDGKKEDDDDHGLPKFVKDLHTGKLIGGWTGKLLVDGASVSMIGLTFSGLYLWGWPKWRRRQR